jgi:hypothetical protein
MATSEMAALRKEIQRLRVYLGVSLAILGTGTLVSLALMGFYGTRLAARLSEADRRVVQLDEGTAKRAEEMRRELVAQGAEIIAIRKSATDDLQAMREAQRKLSGVRDPATQLAALREANEALWTELANQKAELLGSLRDRSSVVEPAAAPTPSGPRFRLGATSYVDPGEEPAAVKGFLPAGEAIHRATNRPAQPALLVIDVTPEGVALGERYRLEVRLVNQSNRTLEAKVLRLDWSFNGMNTGGDVPVEAAQIDAQRTTLLYQVSGQWSEAQERSPVSVTATVTLFDGARLSNTLEW